MEASNKVNRGPFLGTLLILLVICLLYFLLSLISDIFLITDDVIVNYFSERLSENQLRDLPSLIEKRRLMAWMLIPVLLIKNLFFTSMCFSIGALLWGAKFNFLKFLQVTMYAEFINMIPLVIKLLWFVFIKDHYSLEDLRYFAPLSLLDLVGWQNVDTWFIYPLRLVSCFELLYWLALAYFLGRILQWSLGMRIAFVASTYGVGLLVWVLFIVFLMVSAS